MQDAFDFVLYMFSQTIDWMSTKYIMGVSLLYILFGYLLIRVTTKKIFGFNKDTT